MDLRPIIPTAYSRLEPGTTQRDTCPACFAPGKTFTVTRSSSGYVWHCFRDSCGVKGSTEIPYRGGEYIAPVAARVTAYTHDLWPINDDDRQYFEDRFSITSKEILDAVRVTDDSCYMLPVFRADGTVRGYIKRLPNWKGLPIPVRSPALPETYPKTVNYLDSADEVPLSWHRPIYLQPCKYTFLVEDWVSAARIQELGYTSIALLGSSLSDARVRELQQSFRLDLCWAPDPDAIGTALKHAQKYGPAFRSLRVVFLDCDPKDYEDSDKLLHDLQITA